MDGGGELEDREGGGGVDVFGVKFLLCHDEHHDSLGEHKQRPYSA